MTDITVLTGTDYIEFHFNDLSTLAQLKEDILHKSNVDRFDEPISYNYFFR